jgi:hypothetical protein
LLRRDCILKTIVLSRYQDRLGTNTGGKVEKRVAFFADAHAAFECALAVAPEDRASLRAQGQVAERVAVLKAVLNPQGKAEEGEGGEELQTDLDEMD